MKTIRIKYIGGKSIARLPFMRRSYYFTKENDYISTIPENAWNFLKQTGEFIPCPLEEEPKEEIVKAEAKDRKKCFICGFKAKSEYSLTLHMKKHLAKKDDISKKGEKDGDERNV